MNRALALLAVAMLAVPVPAAGGVTLTSEAQRCVPKIFLLPTLEGHESSALLAMNEEGLGVGWSGDENLDPLETSYTSAVMWRDGVAVDLGVGGGLTSRGPVFSSAIDVNSEGVVAIQRSRFSERFRVRASSAWLWRDGVPTRLLGERLRKRAHVQGVNDEGVAVGFIDRAPFDARTSRPVLWRDANAVRLHLRRGAAGGAWFINDQGLVIGWRLLRNSPRRDSQLWYWRLDGGSGPIRSPSSADGFVNIVDVDNRGRILGNVFAGGKMQAILWRGPESRPELFGGQHLAASRDMDDAGDLTGSSGGFRGQSDRAWIAHVKEEGVVTLPDPPNSMGWRNTVGTSVARGVTPMAPQGGVSVGGFIEDWDYRYHATIWTCAQTY